MDNRKTGSRSPPSRRHSRNRSISQSSQSSHDSGFKRRQSLKDPATEEISDGEMESEHDDAKSVTKSLASDKNESKGDGPLNISHEDLSDVSDLDSMGPTFDEEEKEKSPKEKEVEDKQTSSVNITNGSIKGSESPPSPVLTNGNVTVESKFDKLPQEKTSKTEDVEEQLDFEAEEGECVEAPPQVEQNNGSADVNNEKEDDAASVGKASVASSLEEGEVSDEGERRPEETEPRPVCRFYSRGQCTWGMSCRFLHPGVTDKGNYTMFDLVRAVPAGAGGPHPAHHLPPHPAYHREPPPPTESAWERGLRTAKEMLRKANKRKEQDMDFEEKRLHMSAEGGTGADVDAELAYAAAAVGASPPAPRGYGAPDRASLSPPAEMGYAAAVKREPVDYYRPYGAPRHRFPPGHPRGPAPYPDERYERPPYERPQYDEGRPRYEERQAPPEDGPHHKRRPRSTREVIVQRAARGPDDWADPWMRGSPASRRPPVRKRSSGSSYSSSSSRSSRHSRSRAVPNRRPSPQRPRRAALSPSVIVKERRAATARATAMNPPAPRGRRAPSPAAARQHAANPPAPTHKGAGVDAFGRTKTGRPPANRATRKRYSRSSSSGTDTSSSSSESDSDSRSSSSSRSSSDDAERRARAAGRVGAIGSNRIRLNMKQPPPVGSVSGPLMLGGKKEIINDNKDSMAGKKRSAASPPNNITPAKKSVSRREELLKQLKAVEDAIARKRSKI